MLNYLVPLTLVTLFVSTKLKLGVGQLRPFDACVLLLLLWLAFHVRILLRTRITAGFLILIPYFALHVISAYAYYPMNGLREAVQSALLLGFALVLIVHADRADYEKMGRVMLIGLIAIMLFNIGWHIQQGYWSGWKRLHDPKAAFTFLPMLLGVMLIFAARDRRQLYWWLWSAVGVAILFSGERKALLVYGILTIVLLSRGRFLAAAPIAIASVFALAVFATVFDDPYVSRQIRTVIEPTSTSISLAALAEGQMPVSLSNAAREFSFNQMSRMLAEEPFLGVGTNAYMDIVERRFAYLPDYLRAGVHGEFFRVFVENGAIGLLFYSAIWLIAFLQLRQVIAVLRMREYLDAAQAAMLPIMLLVPPLFYVGFEASGTRVLVATIVASLSPLFVYRAMMQGRPQNSSNDLGTLRAAGPTPAVIE